MHAENAKELIDIRIKALQQLKQEQTFGDSRNDQWDLKYSSPAQELSEPASSGTVHFIAKDLPESVV